jgi:hypothetical protein
MIGRTFIQAIHPLVPLPKITKRHGNPFQDGTEGPWRSLLYFAFGIEGRASISAYQQKQKKRSIDHSLSASKFKAIWYKIRSDKFSSLLSYFDRL